MLAVIVIVWIMVVVVAIIVVGSIVLAVTSRRGAAAVAERETDRAAAQASLAGEAERHGASDAAVRDQEGRFN